MDILDLFDRGSAWTASKIPASTDGFDKSTPCEAWSVRALVNHMLDVQGFVARAAKGEPPSMPADPPPDLVGDNPAEQYEAARQEALAALREPGAIDKAGMFAGICFVDQLVHGWDLARATGQDATMPDDLAESAFSMINGRMDDDSQRGRAFKSRVEVPDDASPQEKLIAYGGRNPS